MKKILLVALNAKYIHSNPAVYCLKTYAVSYQDQIEIAEYTINQQTDDILRDIYRRKPDVIAFSCYIWNITMVVELVESLAQIMPEIPLFLGGPEVSYDAQTMLKKYPALTGIFIGQGETSFQKMVAYYIDGIGNLNQIDGLVCQGQETVWIDEEDDALEDFVAFSDYPFLYGDIESGNPLPTEFENRILYYESSRGCPFACSYCLSSLDKRVRFRNVEKVKQELQFFLDNKVKQVKFIDRTFNVRRSHAKAIWQFLKEQDNGITSFHFEIGADLLKEEELELLSSLRIGQIQLEIGVQTTNPDTLIAIRRKTDLERLKQNVICLQKNRNIKLHLDLIAGLPYEDLESFRRSFNEVYAWQPDELQLGFLKVLKGSAMYDKKEEYGLCYKTAPPYEVLSTNWLSYADVSLLKGVEEVLEMYYNSRQFVHSLRFLHHFFPNAFAFYEALATYYEKQGYQVSSLNRLQRYEILEKFSKEYLTMEQQNVLQELLIYDLYLREKIKSRPYFAKEMIEQKEVKKEKGKRMHIEAFSYDRALAEQTGECVEKPHKVKFDYEERNPVTMECKIELYDFLSD